MLARILVILLAVLPALPVSAPYPPDVFSIWGSIRPRDCLLVLERWRGYSKTRSCDSLQGYKGMVRFIPVLPRGWLLMMYTGIYFGADQEMGFDTNQEQGLEMR